MKTRLANLIKTKRKELSCHRRCWQKEYAHKLLLVE